MSEDETQLVRELRDIAKAGDAAGNTFSIAGERGPIDVHYRPGSSSSLTLWARYDDVARDDHEPLAADGDPAGYRRSARGRLVGIRPLAITLRGETASDVIAKREGINVEYQTGDAAFDRDAYVSTPTTDPVILSAVLGPRVRRGVVALLGFGFREIEIDGMSGNVQAVLNQFPELSPTSGRGKLIVEAFELLISDLPRVIPSGAKHTPTPLWASGAFLFMVSFSALLAGAFAWLLALDFVQCSEGTDEPGVTTIRDGCGAPIALAFVTAAAIGIATAVLLGPLVTSHLRGHAESAQQIGRVRLATGWVMFVLGLIALTVGFARLFRG